MTQFVRNTSQQGLKTPEHAGGQINSPGLIMPLSRRPAPFDHPEWIFELEYGGFRSLVVIQNGCTELISRNGNSFKSFETLRKQLKSPYQGKTVLDGEIVCLEKRGKPQLRDLLFHRDEPCFFAFDVLMSDGKDLRSKD